MRTSSHLLFKIDTACLISKLDCGVAGGGGSSGSATLDRLMDKMPFGPKPKIVDLTSDRKLADKVC